MRFVVSVLSVLAFSAMTSQPMKPGREGATSLIPIIGDGSAWEVIGLTRSLEAVSQSPSPADYENSSE